MYDTAAIASVDAVVINSGATDNTFSSSYNVYGLPGVSYVKYIFFDENNPADSAGMVFQYNVTQAVGLADDFKVNSISFGPNPGSGIFYVSSIEKISKESINIFDTFGKRIIAPIISCNMKNLIIDLSGQPNGLYIIRISNEKTPSLQILKLSKN